MPRVEPYDKSVHTALLSLHTQLTGDNTLPPHTFVLTQQTQPLILGYFCVKRVNKTTSELTWIYGPGYGQVLMRHVFRICRDLFSCKTLQLLVSIDPTEPKDTVMRRLNYYIGLQFKVYDIVFRPKFGPLLKMSREL